MVLAQGGHAVDAAVAANAVMGVVCPMMCGVGGDLFAIVCEHDGKMHGVNASGWAPARLTPEFLESAGRRSMPQSGIHSDHRAWRGRRMVAAARAIRPHAARARARAGDGARRRRISGRRNYQRGVAQPGGVPARAIRKPRRSFLPGRPPARVRRDFPQRRSRVDVSPDCGERQRRRSIAERSRAGSSQGLERRGSTMAAADLAEFRAQWADPISTSYRGWEVFELPPNGAGIAALMMLNILETLPRLRRGGPATRRMRSTS